MARYVDGAGAVAAWINAQETLVGKGMPLANGVHLSEPRSSSSGAVASVQEILRGDFEGFDDVRVTFEVKAVGGERGARGLAERAARHLANTIMDGLVGPAVTVTTRSGDVVQIIHAHTPNGPTFTGVVTGEAVYRFDVTVRCRDAFP